MSTRYRITFDNILYIARNRVEFVMFRDKSTGGEITFNAMGGLILHSTRCVYGDSDKLDDTNIFVEAPQKLMNKLKRS